MSRRPGYRFFACLTLSVCLVCLAPARCAAWGSAAHRIIARVAARRLSDSAKKSVALLLGVRPDDAAIAEAMAQASTYADEIRPLRPDTARWHFVDMPGSASAYVAARDCGETKQGDCAVAAVERFEKVLSDASASPVAKAEALKFLIHLVGDLSQPLHCYGDDEGGNLVGVLLPNKKQTSLHAAWDADLVEYSMKQMPDEIAYANFLFEGIESLEGENALAARQLHLTASEKFDEGLRQGATVAQWADSSPEQWATDSHAVAKEKAYGLLSKQKAAAADATKQVTPKSNILTGVFARVPTQPQQQQPQQQRQTAAQQSVARPVYVLDQAYYEASSAVVERQLVKAGLRLAAVLNGIFK